MSTSKYGNSAGTQYSHFRAWLGFRTTTQEEGRAWVQREFAMHVDDGDFQGSRFSASWDDGETVYTSGWYMDTGWQDVGWVNYGSYVSASGWCGYNSYSVGWQESSVSDSYTPEAPTWAPNAPTNVAVARASDTKNTISWKRANTIARPYSAQYLERSVDGGAYTALATLTSSQTSYDDETTSANHFYQYRIKASNAAGASGWAYSAVTYNTPAAPSSCTATRVSDMKNTISLVHGSSSASLYTGHRLERRMDGGSWAFLATIAADKTSYNDATTSANHSYEYRVCSENDAGQSGWAYSSATYNTPAAPGKPTLRRVSDTAISGSFENPANTATGLDIQRSSDRETWTSLTSASGKVMTFGDNPGGGTFYYRIRNTRGALVSAWVESDGIVTICAPAAPDINIPASGATIPISEDSITFDWTHVPIDGSPQEKVKLRYSTDNGSTFTTIEMTQTASSMEIENDFDVNDEVLFQICTKGAYNGYGPWSAARKFKVCQAPTVVIDVPEEGFVVENMPIHVEIVYSDVSGSLAEGRLSIHSDGREVYGRDVSDDLEFDIEPSDWVPENGAAYTAVVSVLSESTLQASSSRGFSVDFEEPSMTVVDAVPDESTGYVRIKVKSVDDGLQPVSSCTLFRECDGKTVLLADGLEDGDVLVDKYAPLNTPFRYVTMSHAASGAVMQAAFPGSVDTDKMFLYWGEDGIASGRFNPTDEFSVTPSFAAIDVAGGDFPIAVIGTNVSEPHTATVTLKSRAEAMAFYKMALSGMSAVYKTLYGAVMHVIAIPKFAPKLSLTEDRWEITVEMIRVAGDDL